MKAIVQCCAKKAADAGTLRTDDGRAVTFVARPELKTPATSEFLARPDDQIPGVSISWRERLEAYNREFEKTGANPHRLLPAWRLYEPNAYGCLQSRFTSKNLYILSAGWGLVGADYLLPTYDVTFSGNVGEKKWCKRGKRDAYRDFRQLQPKDCQPQEPVYCFCTKEYLPLLYASVTQLDIRLVVYFTSDAISRESGVEYIEYGRKYTNWQYECVQDWLAGRLATPETSK